MNLDGVPVRGQDGPLRVPVVTIGGNVTWVKGKGLVRHDGKSEAALRVIPIAHGAAPLAARYGRGVCAREAEPDGSVSEVPVRGLPRRHGPEPPSDGGSETTDQ